MNHERKEKLSKWGDIVQSTFMGAEKKNSYQKTTGGLIRIGPDPDYICLYLLLLTL